MAKRILYEPGYVFPGTHWQVLENLPSKNGGSWVRCRCLYKGCGNEKDVDANSIRHGKSKTCGCLKDEKTIERNQVHGLRKHSLYSVWKTMKRRCHNKKSNSYKDYGARGIGVCDEWRMSFMMFYAWATTNGWRNELEIDRIDNDGPYSPENCRFVTRTKNQRNKRTNVILTIDGITCTLAEHAERAELPYGIVKNRIKYQWETERLLLPLQRNRSA